LIRAVLFDFWDTLVFYENREGQSPVGDRPDLDVSEAKKLG